MENIIIYKWLMSAHMIIRVFKVSQYISGHIEMLD